MTIVPVHRYLRGNFLRVFPKQAHLFVSPLAFTEAAATLLGVHKKHQT